MPDPQFTPEELHAEEWLPFPTYEGWYSISTLGRYRREHPGKAAHPGYVHKPKTNRNGYSIAKLSRHNRKTTHELHRFVMWAFRGPCPEGCEVNHIDGVRSNSRLSNLEYVTKSGNARHARHVLGRIQKLTTEDTIRVFVLRRAGWSQQRIGDYLGVRQTRISQILLGGYTMPD